MIDATAEWPTIEEAAGTLETSVRTMWRHIERGALEVRKRPMPGRKPANIVNPHDIEKLKPQPFVMSEKDHPENGVVSISTGLPDRGTVDAVVAHFKKAIDAELTARWSLQQSALQNPKLWLTLDQAAEFSGLPRSVVSRLATEGRVAALKAGGWRICRASLEAFSG